MDFTHPAFEPYRALIAALDLARGLPALDALNALAAAHGLRQSRGLPLRFVAPGGRLAARDYERCILETGAVPTRTDTWHDNLNALVWLRYPRFKSDLNAAHVRQFAEETGPERGRRRDALTVLDESGVWLAGPDATLYADLAAHRWQEVLWQRREAVRQTLRVAVVGHALLEKALAPYASMTGKCLWLGDAADAETAACDALTHLASPRALAPLPVQGLPGWDAANVDVRFYANADIFRPAPRRLSAAGTAT